MQHTPRVHTIHVTLALNSCLFSYSAFSVNAFPPSNLQKNRLARPNNSLQVHGLQVNINKGSWKRTFAKLSHKPMYLVFIGRGSKIRVFFQNIFGRRDISEIARFKPPLTFAVSRRPRCCTSVIYCDNNLQHLGKLEEKHEKLPRKWWNQLTWKLIGYFVRKKDDDFGR